MQEKSPEQPQVNPKTMLLSELAPLQSTTEVVRACAQSFPHMQIGDVRALCDAGVAPEKIRSIRECSNIMEQTMTGLLIPSINADQIILLRDTSTQSIQEYFRCYGSRKDIRQAVAFNAIVEVCSYRIPLSFLEKCIENNGPGISLFSETIRSLYTL